MKMNEKKEKENWREKKLLHIQFSCFSLSQFKNTYLRNGIKNLRVRVSFFLDFQQRFKRKCA